MKNKKGNIVVIAIIIVIVVITAGIVGWMFTKKSQAPAPQIINSIVKKLVESIKFISKTEKTDIELDGKILKIEKNEYIDIPCVLSIEGSKDIKVWFCKAEITMANDLLIKSTDLKDGDNLTISGKKIACPLTGMISNREELCIKADQIIVN